MAEEDITYSVDDIIQGELEVEQEVNVILGATSDQKCTYDQGYLYRQPIFVCLTCGPKEGGEKSPGGICLACSLNCHSSHEVEELYTKRKFRCDCGNWDKFGHLETRECQLNSDKTECNENNVYGHNFYGLYCSCNKGFDGEEEMIQCVCCEDWYHVEHCGLISTDGVGELICPGCMASHPFLYAYTDKTRMEACVMNFNAKKEAETSEEIVDLPQKNTPESSDQLEIACATNSEGSSEQNKLKRKIESNETNQKRLKTDSETICQLKILANPYQESVSKLPGVFSDDWREFLCRCEECIELYEVHKLEFLLHNTDTILYYENQAKSTNSFKDGIDAFGEMMTPVQKTELLYQFNNLKEEFTDFLRPFANQGKTVCKEDIHKFFQDLTEKKNSDAGLPPQNCKL